MSPAKNTKKTKSKASMKKGWEGRFSQSLDHVLHRINRSLDVDQRFFEVDIEGSLAHAKMLKDCKILTAKEHSSIKKGLLAVLADYEKGKLKFPEEAEDVHLYIESLLIKKIGALGGKLHTARSRNDQVATDARLYLSRVIKRQLKMMAALIDSLCQRALDDGQAVLPAYTHLQRGQPVLLGHHLQAYTEMLWRDANRLQECLDRTLHLPLGSAACTGNTFPIDQKNTAQQLGFSEVMRNSLDAVSDRDFILEYLFAVSICVTHLSRLAEDLILWTSQEFGFVSWPDRLATGSSIMPQKKNPDGLELIRAKTGRLNGNLLGFLSVLKALPLTYNKDMQEDKEFLFDSIDTLDLVLPLMQAQIEGAQFKPDKMRQALKEGFVLATELANHMVDQGLPFRKAHELTGKLVAQAEAKACGLEDLSLDEFQKIWPQASQALYQVLDADHAVNQRRNYSGTCWSNVKRNVKTMRQKISKL